MKLISSGCRPYQNPVGVKIVWTSLLLTWQTIKLRVESGNLKKGLRQCPSERHRHTEQELVAHADHASNRHIAQRDRDVLAEP